MKRILITLVLVIGLSGVAWGADKLGRIISPIASSGGSSFSSNTLNTPGIDVWRVQCSSPTTIRAYARSDDPAIGGGPPGSEIVPETLHVVVMCVNPVERRGKGDHEITQLPERIQSEGSEAVNCQEALVIYSCDYNSPCDGNYTIFMDCVNRTFLAYPIQTLNR